MTLTSEVHDELTRVAVAQRGCRTAQLAATLRLAGDLRVARTGLVVEAVVHTGAMARHLRREIAAIYGYTAAVTTHTTNGLRRGAHYRVRVEEGGTALAYQCGMVDRRGRMVAGLPPTVVGGSISEVIAAWRGAILASGTLNSPGRNTALDIACPSPETAYALASCARRIGLQPLVRESRGLSHVTLRDEGDIGKLLTMVGADNTRISWERRVSQREMYSTAARLANLDEANMRRSARAAAVTVERVLAALEALGPDAPEHLAYTGQLRITHRSASLEELGQLAEPPMTKDAVAGRLRRLLALADRAHTDSDDLAAAGARR